MIYQPYKEQIQKEIAIFLKEMDQHPDNMRRVEQELIAARLLFIAVNDDYIAKMVGCEEEVELYRKILEAKPRGA